MAGRQEVQFRMRIGKVRLPGGEHFDLRDLQAVIGIPDVHTDEIGRNYFRFPAPFDDLKVIDDATITVQKAIRIAEAIAYFRALKANTE